MAALKRGAKAFVSIAGGSLEGIDFLKITGFDLAYIEGFKQAGDSVLAAVAQAEMPDIDARLLPACYLYRHSIELHLKYLLQGGKANRLIVFEDEDLGGHGLHQLWNATEKLIRIVHPDETPDSIAGAGSTIQDFHRIDPSGQEWRYHERADGKQSLKKLSALFNARHLSASVADLYEFLKGYAETLDAMIGEKPDSNAAPPQRVFRAFPVRKRPSLIVRLKRCFSLTR